MKESRVHLKKAQILFPKTEAIADLKGKRALLIYPNEDRQPVKLDVLDSPDGNCSVQAWQSWTKEQNWEDWPAGEPPRTAQAQFWARYFDEQAALQAVESLKREDSPMGYDLELLVDDESSQ